MVSPEKCNIIEKQDKAHNTPFRDMIEVSKEEMEKSLKEINESSDSGKMLIKWFKM